MVNFNDLLKEGVTPNGFYVMCCLDKDQPMSQLVNLELEMSQLPLAFTDFDQRNITAAGRAFVKKHSPKQKVEVTDEMIKEFNDLFPNEESSTTGKKLRCSATEVRGKLQWFLDTHGYGWNTILLATAQYVDRYEKKRPAYSFMRNSAYFIKKQEQDKSIISDLASECASIVEDGKSYEAAPKRLHSDVV